MSKTIRRASHLYAGLLGGVGIATLASVAVAAPSTDTQPQTFKLSAGKGGPFNPNAKAIKNATPGNEQPALATIEKNGKLYLVVAFMNGDVPNNLRPNQVKCSSMVIDPVQGPQLVADSVYLTENQNTDRPGNHPALIADQASGTLLFSYGYAPNNGNTQTYVRGIDENCKSVTNTLRVSNNNNQNQGAPAIAASPTAGQFLVGYYSNNNNTTYVRTVQMSGNTIKNVNLVEAINNTNIGRPSMVTIGDRTMLCTGKGNQRPPNEGLACSFLDATTGNVIWKNKIIAKTNAQAKQYYNQATVVPIDSTSGEKVFGVSYIESTGAGKNNNSKGGSTSHLTILSPTDTDVGQGPVMDHLGVFASHAAIVSGAYGENGDPHLAFFEAPIDGSGPPAITFVHYNAASKTIDPVDTQKNQWIAGVYNADSGVYSKIFGQNPNSQGRDFMAGLGNVKNPGYGLPNGFMKGAKTLFVMPYDGRPQTADEPKNALYLSFLPGQVDKPVSATPPADKGSVTRGSGVNPGSPQGTGNEGTPSPNAPSAGGGNGSDGTDNSNPLGEAPKAGCSVGSEGASSGSSLAALGFALLGLAASRRRKES